MKQQIHGKVIITNHAHQRLGERFPQINKKNRQAFVTAARYQGITMPNLENQYDKLAKYIKNRFHANNSTVITFYKNGVFLYCGSDHKARVLRTAYALDEGLVRKLMEA